MFHIEVNYTLERDKYDAVKSIINRDYLTFSVLMPERYFKHVLIESKKYPESSTTERRNPKEKMELISLQRANWT